MVRDVSSCPSYFLVTNLLNKRVRESDCVQSGLKNSGVTFRKSVFRREERRVVKGRSKGKRRKKEWFRKIQSERDRTTPFAILSSNGV